LEWLINKNPYFLYLKYFQGPPLRSLNEDILGPPEKQSRIEMPEPLPMPTTTNLLANLNQQQQPSAMANSSVGAENGREIIELDDEEEEDIYWVTVFGFQPAQRDDILELFSRHGDIMAQKVFFIVLLKFNLYLAQFLVTKTRQLAAHSLFLANSCQTGIGQKCDHFPWPNDWSGPMHGSRHDGPRIR
jgi:hypothetical protein